MQVLHPGPYLTFVREASKIGETQPDSHQTNRNGIKDQRHQEKGQSVENQSETGPIDRQNFRFSEI